MNDKELIPLCERLAARFLKQAKHLGAPKDAFDELVNVAYVAGKEGRHIIWELIEYVTKPTISPFDRRRRAFRTGDRRRLYRDDPASPEEIAEEKDDRRKAFELLSVMSPDDIVLICLYFGREKSYKDIGKIYNRSGWWVSLRIRGILDSLRKEMEK